MLSCLHFVPSTASLPQRGVQTNCRVRLLSFSAHQQRRLAAPHSRTLSRCVCSASSQPEKAAGAIALGLKAYEKADYNEAIGMFKDALTLPGSGIKQYRSALHSGANPMFLWNGCAHFGLVLQGQASSSE